ncbi:MAG: sodium:solute symporter family protein [Woeseiaceae bacterium]|nr:sodium:solute symporter family protein [Woeseiaceae bacterium]
MSTENIIFSGVALYMLVMLGVGFYASKRSHTVTDFMVAGRDLKLPILSMTVLATWFGGAMLLGGAGAAFDDGMLGVIADPWGGALALILVGLFFARLFRRLKIITVADFMEQRFGKTAAVAITITTIFSNVMWVAGMLVAFGTIFDSLTNIPIETGIIIGAIIVFVYTMVGGMWAVALTDFIQMTIIIVGLVILLTVVLIDVGGWGAIGPQLPSGTFNMLPPENTAEQWLNYLRAWTIIGLVDITAQSLFQRASAARTANIARNAFLIGGVAYLAFGMIPVVLGIIGSVTMPDLANSEFIIPELAKAHLHPVAIAIFVGAMLAAIMSSADSALLAASSVLAKNVLPAIKPNPSPKLTLLAARISIPLVGGIAILIALRIQVVFDLMVDANILGLAVIVVPFILGAYWRKANRTGANAGIAAGLVTWLTTMQLWPNLPSDFMGLAASLVTMLIVVPLTQKSDPPKPLVDSDGNPVEV